MNNCRTNCIECLCRQVKVLSCQSNSPTSINVGKTITLPAGKPATVTNVGTPTNVILDFGIPKGTDGATPTDITDNGINPDTGGHKYNLNFSDGNSFGFESPKGDKGDVPLLVQDNTITLPSGEPATVTLVNLNNNEYGYDFGIPAGASGSTTGLTNMHVWMESSSATVTIPHSEDIFGVGTPKGIGFSSVQGSSIADFTVAGAAIKVNSPGTYLVTYQFVVKDTRCNVCIRRKSSCVEGGNIQLANPDGNILVSGTMVYLVSPEDIANTNGVFSIANADNTRPMPIDPNSFSWTVTQLNKTYNPTFKRIPFNQ
ncbi:MAG: hypothetical protein RRY36_08075 [Bacteroidaceae bacterium]